MSRISTPDDCIIYGLADDGAPVYQILDTNGTPVLVIGENGGKLLRFIAYWITQTKDKNAVNFFVLKNTPASWSGIPTSHCYGIMSPHDKRANDWIYGTEAERLVYRLGRTKIVVFIDGLECVDGLEYEVREYMKRWVSAGPKDNIFVIASYLPSAENETHHFVSLFRNMYVYGKLSDTNVMRRFCGVDDTLGKLGDDEFVFWENGRLVKFSLEV